jgi:hypothetical protein
MDPYDGWLGSQKRPLEPDLLIAGNALVYDGVDLGADVGALSRSEAAKRAGVHYLCALRYAQHLTSGAPSFEQTVRNLHSVLPGEFGVWTAEALLEEPYVAYERDHDTLRYVEPDLLARLKLGQAVLSAIDHDTSADGVSSLLSVFGVPRDLVKEAKRLLRASLLELLQPQPDPFAVDTWSIGRTDVFLDLILLRGSIEFMGADCILVAKLDHKPLNWRTSKTALYFSGFQLVPISSLLHSSEALCFPSAVGQATEHHRQLNGSLQVLFKIATAARLRGKIVFFSADAKALATVFQMPYTGLWPHDGGRSIPDSIPFDWETTVLDVAHSDLRINTALFSRVFRTLWHLPRLARILPLCTP